MILGSAYRPVHRQAPDHGDLADARRRYLEDDVPNLRFLLGKRYDWLNDHIRPGDVGVELAAGMGAAREHVHAGSLLLTDVGAGDWLDRTPVDATATPFEDDAFDFVIIQNGIHHLARPARFLAEATRILRPGGLLLVQDVKCSFFLRLLSRITRVEGYDFGVDPFAPDAVTCDPDDPWDSNNAVPDLLFDDPRRFERGYPQLEVLEQRYSELLVFAVSGGVTHRTFTVNLPGVVLRALDRIDGVLVRLAPGIFALQRSVVLRHRAP